MKKTIAILSMLALVQVSAIGVAQTAARKPVVAKPAVQAMTLDQEEALCATLHIAMTEEDKTLSADDKTNIYSLAFFIIGRLHARTNLHWPEIVKKYVEGAPNAQKIITNEKAKTAFMEKCSSKAAAMIGE